VSVRSRGVCRRVRKGRDNMLENLENSLAKWDEGIWDWLEKEMGK